MKQWGLRFIYFKTWIAQFLFDLNVGFVGCYCIINEFSGILGGFLDVARKSRYVRFKCWTTLALYGLYAYTVTYLFGKTRVDRFFNVIAYLCEQFRIGFSQHTYVTYPCNFWPLYIRF